ncbi:MAG TPA: gliding motility protein GldN [Williamwhitmania sp.]|nr:gliding motility protein GldN [Williamwhitmania sp.]
MRRSLRILFGLTTMVTVAASSYAQPIQKESLVQDGIYVKETIKERMPVPYPSLREADVMWSKRVWRIIDLREKMNLPLYFPTQEMQDRKSLIQTLYSAIKKGEVVAYDPDVDDEFTTPMSFNECETKLGGGMVEAGKNEDGSPKMQYADPKWADIKEFLIKEEWYFDKKYSRMEVRIIGICPIRVYYKTVNTGDENADEENTGTLTKVKTFWVYFPEVRKVLANTTVFNDHNDAQRISLDDLFFFRRFESYIVQEGNVYNNRMINTYTLGGVPNMEESERIRNDIFDTEHDLWEF